MSMPCFDNLYIRQLRALLLCNHGIIHMAYPYVRLILLQSAHLLPPRPPTASRRKPQVAHSQRTSRQHPENAYLITAICPILHVIAYICDHILKSVPLIRQAFLGERPMNQHRKYCCDDGTRRHLPHHKMECFTRYLKLINS